MVKSKRSVQLSRRFLKRDFLKLDNLRESSANTYYTTFLTLETEYGSNPLIKLYTDGLDDIIDFINNKYGSRGERFKSLLVTILKIPKYNNLLNEEDKEKLKESNVKDIKENKRIAYNKTTTLENKINWDDFIKRVNSIKITDKSVLTPHDVLLLKLYVFRTIRDDYGKLNLIKNNNEIKDNENYYNINSHEITLNNYKTSRKFGRIIFKLPLSIVSFIKEYNLDDLKNKYLILNKSGLPYNDFKLSNRLRQILNILYGGKKREFQLSLNTLRQSRITKLIDTPRHTYEQREELSNEMLSSVELQTNNYKRI